jgi:hypothetical protein
MKMSRYLITLFFIAVISSCISINTISPDQKLSHDELRKLRELSGDKPKTVLEDNKERAREIQKPTVVCPVFVLPEVGDMPEIPLKELAKISPTDQKAMDRIETEHIAKLRLFIIHYRETLRDSHNSYLNTCFSVDKKPADK